MPLQATGPAGRSRTTNAAVAAGVLLIIAVAAGGFYLTSRHAPTGSPAAGLPAAVAVVHSGPAVLTLESLTGGRPGTSLQLPGTPETVVTTPDRSKAFLLDSQHGDVIPVDLAKEQVGSPIAAGKLPVDEALSADGTTLYVTDNLGGALIPIDTATGRVEPVQSLTQGVDFYSPSPTSSGGVVGIDTPEGQPGVVVFYDPTTKAAAPAQVGSNVVQAAFYARDGRTVWVVQRGVGSGPSALIPIDAASRSPGSPITLGHSTSALAMTPNGALAVFANTLDSTVSIVDLSARTLIATVPVGATPDGVEVSADGTTAWIACALDRTVVPVDMRTYHAGAPLSLGNSPRDLALPAARGAAWVLFPGSAGSITFLRGSPGSLGRAVPVGNGPSLLIAHDSSTAWVANQLGDTVQHIDIAGETAGPAISVSRAPSELHLTPDGATLLVLSFGDGRHAGALTAIDTRSSKPRAPLAVGPAPGSLTLTPDGATAFVAIHQSNAVDILDVAHWRTAGSIDLPCSPTDLAITPDGGKLYAACGSSAQLVSITVSTRTAGKVMTVGGNPRLVMAEHSASLLVLEANQVQMINTATDTIVKTKNETANIVDAAPTPDDTAFLAVDNSGGAVLQIDPGSLATKRSLALGNRPEAIQVAPDGVHAYALDASDQRVYIIDVAVWALTTTVDVAPNASGLVVPSR